MLSRVADALFWMGRYLERAAFLARDVDVTFHLDLDLHGVLAAPVRADWDRLLPPSSPPPADGAGGATARWILLDGANPASVMACVNRARNNARMIRGQLSSQMWRELNKLYWHLSDPAFQERVAESPHDFCQDTQVGVLLCHGICESTFTHDEGWHFIQLGTHLERAEQVLRVLDARLRVPDGADAADLPVATLRWAAVLKRCRAFEAYQRLFISRVEAERVVEFLLLHRDFPQSARFC
ncbi:MAG: alpha-E domain-containing protein, partial [Planctomycetia bacterium]